MAAKLPRRAVRSATRTRLVAGITILGAVLLTGAAGYHLLEGWSWLDSLYMTVITISTVGYKEVGPLSGAGKLFTIAIIFCGIGAVALTGTSFLELLLERHTGGAALRRKMKKAIEGLTGHIIVCGYGRMGRFVLDQLGPYRKDCVIVDESPEVCRRLEEEAQLVVEGDATEEEVLESAGVRRAEALVATLDTDADNLYLTLTAHALNPGLKIVVRAEEVASHAKFLRAGAAKVVSPYAIGANHIAQVLARPQVVDFVELVTQRGEEEFEVEQIEVKEDSPFVGKTIAASRLRQALGRMILAIKQKEGTTLFDPSPETLLRPGDVLVSIGHRPAKPGGAGA